MVSHCLFSSSFFRRHPDVSLLWCFHILLVLKLTTKRMVWRPSVLHPWPPCSALTAVLEHRLTPFTLSQAPGLHGKVVRDFLRDYGVKQRALEAGILQELSKEEAEADIIQRGALVGMALR